jgi:UDP-N-acetylglucosamine 1-carboxyvinyltransferase
MKAYFEVQGGAKLRGSIQPQGAKNEALQIIPATLLTEEPVVVKGIPDILDVRGMIALVQELGCDVQRLDADTYRFQAQNLDPERMRSTNSTTLAKGMRGSIMTLGPMLSRYGCAHIFKPGGDKIGRRRLDTHFAGMEALGASFDYDTQHQAYTFKTNGRLRGAYMLLDEASVTGTANIIMAAVLAKGTTTIYNAACEPYIQQLCKMLCRMGATIQGIGSNLLTIEGVERLNGTEHTLLADMIEVGSFMGMAAMTRSELTIKNVNVAQLGIMPRIYNRLGLQFEFRGDDIFIPEQDILEIDTFIDGSILTISDHTWPGLTPDILSVMLVVATQCRGSVLIHQKMFESRLFFTDKLIDMGARIILCDPHRATVIGHGHSAPLRAISMTSPDIRAGVALLIAALSAQGTSRIYNIDQIDRGYQHIEARLQSLGAKIMRVIDEN